MRFVLFEESGICKQISGRRTSGDISLLKEIFSLIIILGLYCPVICTFLTGHCWLQLNVDESEGHLDAEFLLTHMCTVGFQEWIVVLATLLRQVEVGLSAFVT